jgi:hypothetical protein
MALIRQHIITFSILKFAASSLAQHVAGYRVRNWLLTSVMGYPHHCTEIEIFVIKPSSYRRKYCNVDGHGFAKQRLGKQASVIEILFSMGSALLQLMCNGSVNAFQQ